MLTTALSCQGLVTAAQKLNRKGLLAKFEKEVKEAYGTSS